MTRRSKRELERAIERLRGGDDGPSNVEVASEVVEITEDDVDENGTVDGPTYQVEDGAVAAELDTSHDTVSAWLVQSEAGAGS